MIKPSYPEPRIAIVQHGDYSSAYGIFCKDLPEPYAGMKKSVEAIEDLVIDRRFLLISLDGDSDRTSHHSGQLVGLPQRQFPRFVPRRLAAAWQRSRVMAEIRKFAPTHLLIRTSGHLAVELLSYCAVHQSRCLVIFANVFDPQNVNRSSNQRLIDLLNKPCVDRVANHLQPAVDSMLECGLRRDKAIAYDFDLPPISMAFEPKELNPSDHCELMFAGNLVHAKGCQDVVLATIELRKRGMPVRLSVFGDGPDREMLEQLAGRAEPEIIKFYGRQPNGVVRQAMRASTFVCVASHREFPEGMPMTLTEALTTRSPVIASTHPVFVRAFQDGEGLRFVPEKRPEDIADAVEQLWNAPAEYSRLSESTSQALERVKCDTPMSSLLKEWSETFEGVCS
jgi:glycosyltransferase involved in cell wall biosynthesis